MTENFKNYLTQDQLAYIASSIKAPYVSVALAPLGGDSIMITLSLQDKKDWINGYIENSPLIRIHLTHDKVDYYIGKKLLKARNSKFTTMDNFINKLNSYLKALS